MTITTMIGNSDNKLMQAEWASFYLETHEYLKSKGQIHFDGHSLANSIYQNACIVINFEFFDDEQRLVDFKEGIKQLAKKYNQESIACVFGQVNFIS